MHPAVPGPARNLDPGAISLAPGADGVAGNLCIDVCPAGACITMQCLAPGHG